MTATLDREEAPSALASTCRHCQEPVLRTVSAGTGRLVQLDPTPVPGGLYELRASGGTAKASRRNILHVTREIRRVASYGGGLDKHECAPYGLPLIR